MKRRKIDDNLFVPIVRDLAIAEGGTAEGRVIPVLVLDCRKHPELQHHLRLHESVPVGDHNCTWGANKKFVFLLFEFLRPTKLKIGIKFEIEKEFSLADGIVQARGVYLQSNESEDKVLGGLLAPRILVEVPPGTVLNDWDKRLLTALTKRMKREGLDRKQARDAAIEALKRTREIWSLRTNN